MGYAMMIGRCLLCEGMFSFNPMKVPSLPDKHGVKQPICKSCLEFANEYRVANGLPRWPDPHPEAYTFCDEAELG